jgi:MFS transporter, DHA1 family, multidrug resistance protein
VALPRGRSGSRRELLVVLGLLSAFGPWSIDMYLPGLPELTRDLHTSAAPAQLTLTACMVGLALGQVVSGPWSDARGRRGPLLLGLLAYTTASVVCGLAPDVWTLVALRLVQGAAGGAGIVIARAVVRDLWGGTEAARVFALLMIVNGIAPIVAPLVGGQVLRISSWHGIFLALAAVGAALTVLAALRVPETLPVERRHRGGLRGTVRVFGRLVRDRTFVAHALSFGLAFCALFAYISGSSFVLENVYGLSPQGFSLVFAGNSLAMVAVAQLSGRLVGSAGPERLLTAGLLVLGGAAVELLATTLAHGDLAAIVAGLVVLAASIGFVIPNGTALALSGHGDVAGSASALLGLTQFGLGAAVAPLVGVAGSRSGLPMGIAIATCAFGALAVHLALGRSRPDAAPRADTSS